MRLPSLSSIALMVLWTSLNIILKAEATARDNDDREKYDVATDGQHLRSVQNGRSLDMVQKKADGEPCDECQMGLCKDVCESGICAWHHPDAWGLAGRGWKKLCGKVANDEYCRMTAILVAAYGDWSCESGNCEWEWAYYVCK
uniref:Uncharacterized protein n=1 Tax=Pseudictyota dubia TaxID=2749911 RepID=A0A7R9Z7R1_9STRA|mmetsp:Transcript_28514/g.53010  ORF Transcript_28514/g.53010 Transcript_28514/m.53010 type:complete len:143 (+) Transcript_28514:240-668(+)